MKRVLLVTLVALVPVCVRDAAAAPLMPTRSSTCAGSSPRAVVRAYYGALNRHQSAAAQACFTSYFLTQTKRTVDPDWSNVRSVRNLHLRSRSILDRLLPGNVPARYARPYAAAQVTAEFDVRYYRIVSSPNGPTARFIYVVEQKRGAPWRIAAIGSGP